MTGVRRLIETSGDLMYAIESAAPFEPVASEAWEEGLTLHRAGCGLAIERIWRSGRSSTPSGIPGRRRLEPAISPSDLAHACP